MGLADSKLDTKMEEQAKHEKDPTGYLARVTMCRIEADETKVSEQALKDSIVEKYV